MQFGLLHCLIKFHAYIGDVCGILSSVFVVVGDACDRVL